MNSIAYGLGNCQWSKKTILQEPADLQKKKSTPEREETYSYSLDHIL
jgi:hypothetical protein